MAQIIHGLRLWIAGRMQGGEKTYFSQTPGLWENTEIGGRQDPAGPPGRKPAAGQPSARPAAGKPPGQGNPELDALAAEISACEKCALSQGRQHTVFGEGDPQASLVFVGEAPGAEEDRQGLPFVGEAGKLLTRMINAIGLERSQVYICNTLKCRPPGNRNPLPSEIEACQPYLSRQLQVLKPRLICALGTFAAQTLLASREPIGRLRGKIFDYQGIPVIPTFHPAALLYHPQNKRQAWEDLKLIARQLGLEIKTAK